jgi:hypothetical protein
VKKLARKGAKAQRKFVLKNFAVLRLCVSLPVTELFQRADCFLRRNFYSSLD